VAAPLPVVAPIGIRSHVFDGPLPAFRYAYETENDIQQSAEGQLKTVGDSEVINYSIWKYNFKEIIVGTLNEK
jgi:hypothetical protein